MSKYILFLALLIVAAPAFANKESGEITGTGSSNTLTCENGVSINLYDGTWANGAITLMYYTLVGTWEEVRVSGAAKTWGADDNDNANINGSVTYRLDATTSVTSVDYDMRCKTENY